MSRTPKTSPQPQRKGQSPRSADASFSSYRTEHDSEEEDEVDRSHCGSEAVDEVDQSFTVGNISHGSLNRSVGGGNMSPKQVGTMSTAIHGRRALRSRVDSSSPRSTPGKSDHYTSSSDADSPQSQGSPSLYPDISPEITELHNEEFKKRGGKSNQGPSTRQRRINEDIHRPVTRSSTKQTEFSHSQFQKKTTAYKPPPVPDYSSSLNLRIVAVVVVGVLLVFGLCWLMFSAETPEVEETPLTRLEGGLNQLKTKFPSQDNRFWKILNAATKRIIIDKEPIQPAVVLIGSAISTSREADCLAQHFSQVIENAFQSFHPLFINVSTKYVQMTPEDAKVDLEQNLKSAFDGGTKSAVLGGLEELHGSTAMLLHAFCDNDNAPYKKVVIVFTLHTDEQWLEARDDSKVENFLSNIWQRHLNYDDVHALLSRVANNIIIPKKETESTLSRYC